MDTLTIVASKRNWIDHRSIETLQQIAHYQGITKVVGLPDLSVGNVPNGMAVLSETQIYPHLIGGDIGCGMSLFEMPLTQIKKLKVDTFEKKLKRLNSLDAITIEGEPSLGYHLGSIGKGNHFAELHRIHEIKDQTEFDRLKLEKHALYALIHSGSRAFGQQVFESVAGCYDPTSGLVASSELANAYLSQHDQAILYAHQSRKIIAQKLFTAIGFKREMRQISATAHNSILQTEKGWLHRKGATPTDQGAVIIAGSRGTLSYLVLPTQQTAYSNHSLAHGAGRKWERSSARSRLERQYRKSDLERTEIGSRVLCNDAKLLYEEAPQAYKNIDIVIDDLVQAGLATVIATFKPILTYKE